MEAEVRRLCEEHGADRIFVLTDSNVHPLTANFLPNCPRLVVAAGEDSKSLKGVEMVWDFLSSERALRRSALVNVGGGMVCDLGGFAASTFKRGIGCVNVPTTLLAAVDAAIGGKTGVNFRGLKNEIGTFALPWGVFPLTSLFPYLPEAEWLSGVGEAIKTGLLVSERLFALTTSEDFILRRSPEAVEEVVKACAEFKMQVVDEDLLESGSRKILNLGHTAGHAIESLMLMKGTPVPHGVAVAHGLRVALDRSVKEAGFPQDMVDRYEAVLNRFFPPVTLAEEDRKELERLMAHDKKITVAGRPAWVLLKDIGQPAI